ncbi:MULTISPECIES: XdhC family protein [Thalassobaculum]|uniref:Xanthine dehydrogenase accessory factor n=1 Tax=Thalassobaculum litoreum DSM 18839 TaxID=1123362 RepID=A0A8G2BNB0_9PROT|nr:MULTISPECIES: XdhC family protein [Thalassobaculum]SDG39727.1 xanthine dehydrogenase accessory factor [Thalassobaculum litoreum DSM 18839]
MRADIFSKLQTARRSKTPVTLVDGLDGKTQALVYADKVDGDLSEAVVKEARDRLRDNKSGVAEVSGDRWFFDCHNPPLRLIIVGAVHITQTLVPMASIAGYEVIVVDPRASFATAERFPNVTLIDDWPDEAMEALKPDSRTAVVTLTHDPKLDDPALEITLKSDAFYITCLGSRRTHAKRVERLKEMGFDDAAIGRIHAPAGLDIGAVSPAEIAISVLAELTAVLHAKPIVAAAA